MSNKKSTKRALITSLFAVAVCVVMLIGTTFAWFTDTASTSVNKIQAGTLGIELQYEESEGMWKPVTEDTVLAFKKATESTDDTILWEPGCTYELPALKVVNTGNLALKYKLQITGIKGDEKLNEAIEWTIDGVEELDTDVSLEVGGSDEIIIKGHMKEDAGNEYQGLSISGISITALATQDTVEYDSYNNTYDEDAPVYTVTPENAQEVLDSIEGYAVVKLTAGDYGTLYFRQSENSELYTDFASTTHNTGTVKNGYVGYGANQSHVDALYLRKLSNVTIEGCDGATVDNIKFMIGYYKYDQIKDGESVSGNVIYKDYTGGDFTCTKTETNGIFSFFEVKNMTIKNVNFSGNKTVLSLAGNGSEWCTVDGMHFIGCSMDATENTSGTPYFWSIGKATNNDIFKNFSLENCSITGASRVMSVCGVENLKIVGNTFKNIKDRDLHIHADGTTASIDKSVKGNVIISKNTSDGGQERFIRIGNAKQMNLTITDNTVTNYAGKDNDYIKVSGKPLTQNVSGNTAAAADGRTLEINFAE